MLGLKLNHVSKRGPWTQFQSFIVVFHSLSPSVHDDVIKWKYFPRCWPFVKGIHRSPMDSPHKDQWDAELWWFLWSAPEQLNKQSSRWWFETHNRAHYNLTLMAVCVFALFDGVMTWKRFLHYWPFVAGIHRSPQYHPYKNVEVWCFTMCWYTSGPFY